MTYVHLALMLDRILKVTIQLVKQALQGVRCEELSHSASQGRLTGAMVL
jgi:hypothetical protein